MEIDKETGNIDLIDYVAVVDCGTPINPNLARVQTEGGVAQGIGMALMENVQYSKEGKIRENSFMQYKIPSREDIGNIRVEFESSYEKSGLQCFRCPGKRAADHIGEGCHGNSEKRTGEIIYGIYF